MVDAVRLNNTINEKIEQLSRYKKWRAEGSHVELMITTLEREIDEMVDALVDGNAEGNYEG